MTTEEEVAKVYHTAVNLSKILHEEKKKYDSKVSKLIHDIETAIDPIMSMECLRGTVYFKDPRINRKYQEVSALFSFDNFMRSSPDIQKKVFPKLLKIPLCYCNQCKSAPKFKNKYYINFDNYYGKVSMTCHYDKYFDLLKPILDLSLIHI